MNKRRSKKEMFPLVKRYRESSQKKEAFCDSAGVRVSTFNYWLTKFNKAQTNNFAELEVSYPTDQYIGHVQLSFPNGVVIQVEQISESSLSRLIKL